MRHTCHIACRLEKYAFFRVLGPLLDRFFCFFFLGREKGVSFRKERLVGNSSLRQAVAVQFSKQIIGPK